MHARLGRVAGAAIVAWGIVALGAEKGVVFTKDGRKITGEITQEGDQVRINRNGIVQVLGKDEVSEVRTATWVAGEYQRRLAELSKDDVEAHFRLAEWCRKYARPDLAEKRCRHILAIAPKHTNAKLLLKVLERSRRTATGKDEPEENQGEAAKRTKGELLTKEQINRIRIAELNVPERVGVKFGKGVHERFLDAVAGKPRYSHRGFREDFRRKNRSDQLADIIEATGMFFADEIEIRSDPEAMRVYRRNVDPLIRNSCATIRCHGGPGAPKIRLYSQRTTAAAYTNFYVLDKFEKKVPGRDTVRMFDRGYPEDGFLVHYLLPRELAEPALAHPTEIEPALKGKDDGRYFAVVDWLKKVLHKPRQDPGIEPPKEGKKPETPQKDQPDSDAKR